MTKQTQPRYPAYDTFRGIDLYVGPLILIGAGVFVLIVSDVKGVGTLSWLGVWAIGSGVFSWIWSTRFAWRTWWENRISGRRVSEEQTEGDLHERRVRLAFAHPYVIAQQTFFVMLLMFYAAEYPDFLSLHYGVWFCLAVVVIWVLLSLFFRYIGRGELRDFDFTHRFDEKRGRFIDEEGIKHSGS